MRHVRPAAVAGLFYPDDPAALRACVESMIRDAESSAASRNGADGVERGLSANLMPGPPKALVLPHAGYLYSGSTAALGYAQLAHCRDRIRRVVLLGPTHRVPVTGLALPQADALQTPLGESPVPVLGANLRRGLPQIVDSAPAHAQEHSLEVHLPFLQVVLGDVEVVPLAVGRAGPQVVAEVLDALWGGPETVVVISSDLSHYHPYAEAQDRDERTVRQILALDPTLTHDQACGATPVNGLLAAATGRRLTPDLLGLCNSGDTAGDKRRVVGYAAVGFHEPAA